LFLVIKRFHLKINGLTDKLLELSEAVCFLIEQHIDKQL
jgi:hypothetical protein